MKPENLLLVILLAIISFTLGAWLTPCKKTPTITYETPAKKQVKSVKIVIYNNGCFDAKHLVTGRYKYIVRCV